MSTTSLHFISNHEVLSTSADGTIKVHELNSSFTTFSDKAQERGVNGSCVIGDCVYVVGEDEDMYQFDFRSKRLQNKVHISDNAYHMNIMPCGTNGSSPKQLIISTDNKLYTFDMAANQVSELPVVHNSTITSISKEGALMMTSSLDGTLVRMGLKGQGPKQFHFGYRPIAYSHLVDWETVVVGFTTGTCALLKQWKIVQELPYQCSNYSVPIAMRGDKIFVASANGSMSIYKRDSSVPITNTPLLGGPILAMDICEESHRVVVGGIGTSIIVEDYH